MSYSQPRLPMSMSQPQSQLGRRSGWRVTVISDVMATSSLRENINKFNSIYRHQAYVQHASLDVVFTKAALQHVAHAYGAHKL